MKRNDTHKADDFTALTPKGSATDLRELIIKRFKRIAQSSGEIQREIEDTEKLIEHGPRRKPRKFRL